MIEPTPGPSSRGAIDVDPGKERKPPGKVTKVPRFSNSLFFLSLYAALEEVS
jgi:hypothetical protein